MWGAEMTIPLPPTGAWRLEGGGFARLREGMDGSDFLSCVFAGNDVEERDLVVFPELYA